MADLRSVLSEAAEASIISPEASEQLLPFLTERGVDVLAAPPAADDNWLNQGKDVAPEITDTETPRFVRGFHDVLITVGVVIALLGFSGIGSIYALLPAIIVLAELFIARRRLALPAVAITVAMIIWIAMTAMRIFNDTSLGLGPQFLATHSMLSAFLILLMFPVFLAPFAWRYKVPLSLAALIVSLFTTLLAGALFLIAPQTGFSAAGVDLRLPSAAIFFIFAVAMFAVAMTFDMRDRQRLTRRSDVAFWMHLATAPALLYATATLLFRLFGLSFNIFDNYTAPAILVVIVLAMMLIGLVIDRRAFVTSGLLSLGGAMSTLLRAANLKIDVLFSVELMIIGIFVLLVGMSWSPLRRSIVERLPLSWQEALPVLR